MSEYLTYHFRSAGQITSMVTMTSFTESRSQSLVIQVFRSFPTYTFLCLSASPRIHSFFFPLWPTSCLPPVPVLASLILSLSYSPFLFLLQFISSLAPGGSRNGNDRKRKRRKEEEKELERGSCPIYFHKKVSFLLVSPIETFPPCFIN